MATPEEWGPRLWHQFHAYALAYNPQYIEPQTVRAWYADFADMIPCETCSTKYRSILKSRYALTRDNLTSNRALFEWTVTVHNAVNMFLGKRLVPLQEAWRIHNGF